MLNNSSNNLFIEKSPILGVFTGKPGEPYQVINNGSEYTTTFYYPNDKISVIANIISDGASIHRTDESDMIIFDEKNSLYYFVGIHQNGNLSLKTNIFSAVDVPNLLKRVHDQQANKIIEKIYDAAEASNNPSTPANKAKFISDPNDPKAQEILSRFKFSVKSAGVFELTYSPPITTDISDSQPARTDEPSTATSSIQPAIPPVQPARTDEPSTATSSIQPAIPPVQPSRADEPSTATSANILKTTSVQQSENKKGCCTVS